MTSYHKLKSLEQQKLLSHISIGQKSSHDITGFSAPCHMLKSKGWLGCFIIWSLESSPKFLPSCWQNSLSCSCSTEVSIFLLAVGWGLLSTKSYSHPLSCLSLHLKTSHREFSLALNSFLQGPGSCKGLPD